MNFCLKLCRALEPYIAFVAKVITRHYGFFFPKIPIFVNIFGLLGNAIIYKL